MRTVTGGAHAPRFVIRSHALNAPRANPRTVFIAVTIAIALYLVGCRIRG